MKKHPKLYRLRNLNKYYDGTYECSVKLPNGSWAPVRPSGHPSLKERFRLAIMVFKGECDALLWPQDDPEECKGNDDEIYGV
jgi:hypothetical protein